MIDFYTSTLTHLSAHEVGNKNNGEQLYPTAEPLSVDDEDLVESLNHYFLKPFNAPVFFGFSSSNDDPNLNPVFQFATNIFEHPESFHINSINIAKHLFECTQHPNIKSGDLYVAYISHCMLGETICDAIGIFKSEQKDPFITSERKGKSYKLKFERGINIDHLDKGCLIFNTEKEKGYKVSSIDKSTRGADAQYWKDDFLNIKPCSDSYHLTENFLSVTKAFVTKQMDQEYEVSKTDQIDILNKSVAYFKENDHFNEAEFNTHVFSDEHVIDSFKRFKSEMQQDAELDIMDSFDISANAVKKQARVFKSILKLDKNFHIYIHGNREMIEKGTDSDGRKFYKIYYNNEEM